MEVIDTTRGFQDMDFFSHFAGKYAEGDVHSYEFQMSVFETACECGKLKVIRFLLQHGVDEALNQDSAVDLDKAIRECEDPDVLYFLMQYGVIKTIREVENEECEETE